MKQPFAYYGGKQRMVRHLLPLIPKHTVYVEPFCGGASLFWAKPWPNVTNTAHYREVLNDTNSDVVNFLDTLKNHGTELTRRLALTPYARETHHLAKNRGDDVSPIERAERFFTSISMSFANKLDSGWGTNIFTKNSAAAWAKKVENLPNCISRLTTTYIENRDALKCIKTWDSPQSFFYCDPPYVHTHQGHYSGYTSAHFQSLVDTLDNIEGSFLLSTYLLPGFAIPSNWEAFEFSARNSASGKGKAGKNRSKMKAGDETLLGDTSRTEVVYRKINRIVRPELQFLWDGDQLACYF